MGQVSSTSDINLGIQSQDLIKEIMEPEYPSFATGEEDDNLYYGNNIDAVSDYDASGEYSSGFHGYDSGESDNSNDFIESETAPLLSKHEQMVKRDLAKMRNSSDELPFWDEILQDYNQIQTTVSSSQEFAPSAPELDQDLDDDLKKGISNIFDQFGQESSKEIFDNLQNVFPEDINRNIADQFDALIQKNLQGITSKPDDIRTTANKGLKFKDPHLRPGNIFIKGYQDGIFLTPEEIDQMITQDEKIKSRKLKGIEPLKWNYLTCANICFDCERIIKTNRQGYGIGLSGIKMYFCLKCYICRGVKNEQRTPIDWETIVAKYDNYENPQLMRELRYTERMFEKREERITTELINIDQSEDDEFIPEPEKEKEDPFDDCPLFADTNPFADNNDVEFFNDSIENNIESNIENQSKQVAPEFRETNPFLDEIKKLNQMNSSNQKTLDQELKETQELLKISQNVSDKAAKLFSVDPFTPNKKGQFAGF